MKKGVQVLLNYTNHDLVEDCDRHDVDDWEDGVAIHENTRSQESAHETNVDDIQISIMCPSWSPLGASQQKPEEDAHQASGIDISSTNKWKSSVLFSSILKSRCFFVHICILFFFFTNLSMKFCIDAR